MEFTTTEKNQQKLIRNGYIYVFKKMLANDVKCYECVLRRKNGQCKVLVKLDMNDEFVEQVNEHTHAPSQTEVEVTKIKANIKRKAETTTDTPQQILGAELRNISEDAAANLPSTSTLRRNIHKVREDNMPPNPLSREEIPEIPLDFQNTSAGERFLIFDSGVGDRDRILIFGSDIGLQLLNESEHWYGDGTFKVCPEIYYQLYTLHAQRNGSIFPCIFALLPNKTEVTYRRFFEQIFNLLNHNNLQDILVDFERACINAVAQLDPNIDIKGCFYHLSSNVWKHIQQFGYQQRYNDDQEFALHTRMICAVAFLPPDDVVEGFEQLADLIRETYDNQMDDILEYFEDTYIGRYRRNAPRRPPMFSLNLWNMFHRTYNELPRTNNSVEGWHRRFQSQVSSCHPVFWKFLQMLQNEESLIRVDIIQNLVGHPPAPQRRRYLDCNRRILAIVDDYANQNRMRYLRFIAHNLSF